MDGVRLLGRQIEIRRDHPYHSLGRKDTLKNKVLMNRPDDFMLLFWNRRPNRPWVGFADDGFPGPRGRTGLRIPDRISGTAHRKDIAAE